MNNAYCPKCKSEMEYVETNDYICDLTHYSDNDTIANVKQSIKEFCETYDTTTNVYTCNDCNLIVALSYV